MTSDACLSTPNVGCTVEQGTCLFDRVGKKAACGRSGENLGFPMIGYKDEGV